MLDFNDSHNQKVEIINDYSSETDKSEGSETVVFSQKIKKAFFMSEFFNRFLRIYFGLVIIILFAFLAIPVYNILQNYNTLLERQVKSLPRIDNWERRIIEQEKRLKLLTTESIDGRLEKVEKFLATGNFNKDELKNLQQISVELKKIKSDIYISPARIGEFRELQYKFDIFEQKMENKINDAKTKLTYFFIASICLPIILTIAPALLKAYFPKGSPTKPIED
jgi:hypothetical protein